MGQFGIGVDDVEKTDQDRLSHISTLWTLVADAKGGPEEAVTAAQQELMRRYGPAVHRYLLDALRNPDAADELAQEFALRFLRGDCRRVDPQRGRFRDYIKGVLSHLIVDYYRRQWRLPQPLPTYGWASAVYSQESENSDRQFQENWRNELLARTWAALAQAEKETGKPFHAVLCFRIQHPDLRSSQMAEQLGAQLGKPVTAEWVRQTLHRGRDKFAELLLGEVADTLQDPTPEELEEELSELGLLSYCQNALKRSPRKHL
jgi:RNA polymerase sigma-70 factor (ECF subfamily)